MSTRIEVVDPVPFAGIASEILQAAWKPPCLYYSADYLSWQFSFPSHLPRVGVVAFLDDRAVGCIAVTARHFVCASEKFAAYVFSFLAVHPSAGRRGLASAMYAALSDAIPVEIPMVGFAETGSPAERLMVGSLQRASFRHHPFLVSRAVGFLPRSGAPKRSSVVVETESYTEFSSAARISDQHSTLFTDITEEHFDHYCKDPRQRTTVAVRDENGTAIGTAMIVNANILSSQGIQRVPMLENVALAEPTPDAIAALLEFAAARTLARSTVIASNLSHVDAALVRAAGARALPSSFNPYAFVRGPKHVIETAAALNLEVT